jgi:pseudaminic acid synthase
MNIAGIEIGAGQPCRIVAELSNNHNGDRDRLGRLIDAAQAAGADFVKVQCYTPDELVALRADGPAPEPWGAQGWTMRTLYEKAQTPHAWFPKIKAHCERVGMPWFSSVFGRKSLALLESLGCPAYKVAKFERKQRALVERVMRLDKPVLISSPDGYRYASYGGLPLDRGAHLLYCPGDYPCERSAIRLPLFVGVEADADMGEYEGGFMAAFLGMSYHGKEPDVVNAAVARGCKLIEMHLMLEAEPSELEANVSLNERQFAAMVQSVRRTEELLG